MARSLKGRKRLTLELIELPGLRVCGIFRPTEPDLTIGEFLELLGRGVKTGNVIPMLMREHKDIDMLGYFADIGNHIGDVFVSATHRAVYPAIDEHEKGRAVAFRKPEEMAVADALAIMADNHWRSGVVSGPPFAARGFLPRGGGAGCLAARRSAASLGAAAARGFGLRHCPAPDRWRALSQTAL